MAGLTGKTRSGHTAVVRRGNYRVERMATPGRPVAGPFARFVAEGAFADAC